MTEYGVDGDWMIYDDLGTAKRIESRPPHFMFNFRSRHSLHERALTPKTLQRDPGWWMRPRPVWVVRALRQLRTNWRLACPVGNLQYFWLDTSQPNMYHKS